MTLLARNKAAVPSYSTLLFICCGVAFGGFLGSHMRIPVVPLYARSLGADAVLVGIINSAFLLMAALLYKFRLFTYGGLAVSSPRYDV